MPLRPGRVGRGIADHLAGRRHQMLAHLALGDGSGVPRSSRTLATAASSRRLRSACPWACGERREPLQGPADGIPVARARARSPGLAHTQTKRSCSRPGNRSGSPGSSVTRLATARPELAPDGKRFLQQTAGQRALQAMLLDAASIIERVADRSVGSGSTQIVERCGNSQLVPKPPRQLVEAHGQRGHVAKLAPDGRLSSNTVRAAAKSPVAMPESRLRSGLQPAPRSVPLRTR